MPRARVPGSIWPHLSAATDRDTRDRTHSYGKGSNAPRQGSPMFAELSEAAQLRDSRRYTTG
eukprot:3908570-Pyramimonas_sp.AAC.1